MLIQCVSLVLATLITIGTAAISAGSNKGGGGDGGGCAQAPAGFEIQKLADGVYAAIRKEPTGFAVDSNVLFVVNDDDVVVVDANDTPSSAREVIAAIRKVTSKPVRFVVNTHWHDDHIMGNQVYRDTFPGADFVAHASMREYLPAAGVAARQTMLSGATQFRDLLSGLLEKGKGLRGNDLTAEERESHCGDLALANRYIAESPAVSIVSPTVTIQDRLTLYRGSRVIELLHLGRGHTRGDVVVHLPAEGIVAAGDLVVWPIPLVGSDQSYVGDWSGTLERLRELHARITVPGHGPVLRDDSYTVQMTEFFRAAASRARAAVARGETLEQAVKSVDLDDFRKRFAGESVLRRLVFDNYAASASIGAIYREAKQP